MADSLAKYGVYVDDLCKIRILEPEAANQTSKLKEECQNFVSSKLRRWEVRRTMQIDLWLTDARWLIASLS